MTRDFADAKHPGWIGSRREALGIVAGSAAVVLSGCAGRRELDAARSPTMHRDSDGEEAEVTPGEDLMQEHGVLERVLLVYDEAAGRLERRRTMDVAIVAEAAAVIRRFVEEYHERLEEEHVFPRFEKARLQLDLVAVLREQHRRGREATDGIIGLAGANPKTDRSRLAHLLRAFASMYRPHAAREDTVLFPAFRRLVGRAAYRELGEQFEEREHALLGEKGFASVVGDVARLEELLGIHDLAAFTVGATARENPKR